MKLSPEDQKKLFDIIKSGKSKKLSTFLDKLNQSDLAEIINDIYDIDDSKNFTPLTWAIENNQVKIVELLIEKGAGVNKSDKGGNTPLILSSSKGFEEIVEFLISKKANVNLLNSNGDSALNMSAVNDNNAKIVDLLINENADLNIANKNKETPIIKAAMNNSCKIAVKLMANGANAENRDKNNFTALMYSVKNNNVNLFKTLISNGEGVYDSLKYNNIVSLIYQSKSWDIFLELMKLEPYLSPRVGNGFLKKAFDDNYIDLIEILLKKNFGISDLSQNIVDNVKLIIERDNIDFLNFYNLQDNFFQNKSFFDEGFPCELFYQNYNLVAINHHIRQSNTNNSNQANQAGSSSVNIPTNFVGPMRVIGATGSGFSQSRVVTGLTGNNVNQPLNKQKILSEEILKRIFLRNRKIKYLLDEDQHRNIDAAKIEWIKSKILDKNLDIIDIDILSKMIKVQKNDVYSNIKEELDKKISSFFQDELDKSPATIIGQYEISQSFIEKNAIKIASLETKLYKTNIANLKQNISGRLTIAKSDINTSDMLRNAEFKKFIFDKLDDALFENRSQHLVNKYKMSVTQEEKNGAANKIVDWAVGLNILSNFHKTGEPKDVDMSGFSEARSNIRDDEVNCKINFHNLLDELDYEQVKTIANIINHRINQHSSFYNLNYKTFEIDKYLEQRQENQRSNKRTHDEISQSNDSVINLSNKRPNTNPSPTQFNQADQGRSRDLDSQMRM